SIPFAVAQLAAVFSYRQFRRRGLDPALTGWALGVSAIASSSALAVVLIVGAVAGVAPLATAAGFLGGAVFALPAITVILALRYPRARAVANRVLSWAVHMIRRIFHRPGIDPAALDELIERLGGKPYWSGVQLDETAFPVLLAAQLEERGELNGTEVGDMIRRALSFIVCNGPASDQDRWEEDAGINTFTLAACIAALVCGAPHLDSEARELALAVADYWNASLEDWTSVAGTPLARRQGLAGYYVRVAPREALRDRRALQSVLPVRNQALDPGLPAFAQVGVDFLQLVRFGLRRADDPLIAATVRLADMLLKVDTPTGPCWHRYNDDGYGEHADGSAYDGTGVGRAWPLLTGERGHYELAAGADPLPLLLAMVRMASPGGMLPEQIWDAAPVPARGLEPGRPTGSAMPLAWTHAEYIKLVVSRSLGRPFDRPALVWQRYAGRRPRLERIIWCEHAPASELPEGSALTVAATAPATFRWGFDGWNDICEQRTTATTLGLHIVEIDTTRLKGGRSIDLTYRLEPSGAWVGRDFHISVVGAGEAAKAALAGEGEA
ncbi:MAG: glycoside hydrolase family 15 protein, partial [Steroidobacteraceae bacterium]